MEDRLARKRLAVLFLLQLLKELIWPICQLIFYLSLFPRVEEVLPRRLISWSANSPQAAASHLLVFSAPAAMYCRSIRSASGTSVLSL